MADSFHVDLISQFVYFWKICQFPNGFSDLFQKHFVSMRFDPDAYPQMLISDWKYESIDLVILVSLELSRNNPNEQIEPSDFTLFIHIVLNRKSDHPLPSLVIIWMFPLWIYIRFEVNVVSARYYIPDRVSIVVKSPKVPYLFSLKLEFLHYRMNRPYSKYT